MGGGQADEGAAMGISDARRAVEATALWKNLRMRYAQPWRHYHAFDHPLSMIAILETAEAAGEPLSDPTACVGFALYHNAVWDPRAPRGANEERSAALCTREFAAHAPERSVRAAVAATLATATHAAPDPRACPDGELLIDVDLAILGSAPHAYAAYAAGVRKEYGWVGDEAYGKARVRVLRSFLERPRIYRREWARNAWETLARDNVADEIARLAHD